MAFENFTAPAAARTKRTETRMSLPVAMDIIQELEELSVRVGQRIMALYDSGTTTTRKADGSPVTEADQIAEAMIIERLRELTPDIPIIAEESYAALDGRHSLGAGAERQLRVPDVSGGQFWLVDALDGTREFIARGRDFTVNIGLIVDNLPYLGVIHWPAGGLTYSGLVRENLATRMHADGRREAIKTSQIGDHSTSSLCVVSSKSFGNSSQLARYLTGREIREHRYRASSIKFCEIAEGRADLYPRFGA
jgi:3'(2'), 5'-bisphosphate nucleotidase